MTNEFSATNFIYFIRIKNVGQQSFDVTIFDQACQQKLSTDRGNLHLTNFSLKNIQPIIPIKTYLAKISTEIVRQKNFSTKT